MTGGGRRPRTRRGLALALTAVGVAAPLARHRLRLAKPVVSVLAWAAPAALAVALPRSRPRDAAVYALQMWAYVAHFQMPYDDPEILEARKFVGYPIAADRRLGGGELPTLRLQRALGRPGEVRAHDFALSALHWTWFFVPHGSLVFLLLRHPARFPRAATQIAAVFDVGLLGYWALPTAPPWWAGLHGESPPVRRVMVEAGERFWGRLWPPLYGALNGNPYAAMPSLHFATSVMAAHVLAGAGRVPGAVGWTYAGALGFALVYLGEHYVVDLAAGLALTEGIWRLGPRAAPLLQAAGTAVGSLSSPRPE